MRPSGERLLSVEEALERVLAAAGEPVAVEEVSIVETLDRVLAERLVSSVDLPPWDNSAMDGFALHAADVSGATPENPIRLRVVGDVRAGGSPEVDVPHGSAVRIATGAPMPPSADSVVPIELTVPGPGAGPATAFAPDTPLPESCFVAVPVAAGNAVRRRGDDVKAGALVLPPGTRLRPAHVALAGAVGAGSLCVRRRPIAAVLSTGDELRFPGQDLGPSGIPDANRPGLLALCRRAGAWAVDLGIASDSLDAVLGGLRPAVERSDALIVSGGVSVGPFDVVRLAFQALGMVELWRVALQPGKPFAFGLTEPRESDGRRVLLFGLPGNPVSAFVTFDLFVRPALERLTGSTAPAPASDVGVLEETVTKSAGRRAYLRMIVVRDREGRPIRDGEGRLRVRQAGGQGSHVLSALAAAEVFAIVPESTDRLEAGAEVEVRWLRR